MNETEQKKLKQFTLVQMKAQSTHTATSKMKMNETEQKKDY